MIDVGDKPATDREAVAVGRVRVGTEVVRALAGGRLPKGDALGAARVAGIMAAKRTPELIPLCHPIALSYVGLDFRLGEKEGEVEITATARARAVTGVEMEALTAVAVAALTIHDMCKTLNPAAEIGGICLVRKSGGKTAWQKARSRRAG